MNLRNRVRLSPMAAEASWWLLVAWLLLDVLPGNRYLRLLPPKRSPEPQQPPGATPIALEARAVSQVVDFLSQRLPVRSVCFHRAIAVDRMLRRRRIAHVMHYGVLRENGALKAHVWVTSAGVGVIGLAEAAPYTEIAQFVETSAPSSAAAAMPQVVAGRQLDPRQ
jgi:hypothetical protein